MATYDLAWGTQNPKPQTLNHNPQSSSLDRDCCTGRAVNSKPSALNPKPYTLARNSPLSPSLSPALSLSLPPALFLSLSLSLSLARISPLSPSLPLSSRARTSPLSRSLSISLYGTHLATISLPPPLLAGTHLAKRFRGGLVLEAHRWLYHSTLGSRVIIKHAPRHLSESRASSPSDLGFRV